MKALFISLLLLVAVPSLAQLALTSVDFRVNMGVGINNKPETMFGAPYFLTGDLTATLNRRWQIAAEGGGLSFRDAAYPYDKIGLLCSCYSRYQFQYFGLRVGHTLLTVGQSQQVVVSSGADYLLVIEPNIKRSLSSSFNYVYKRFLNVPAQIDYSLPLTARKTSRLSVSGRWNFNAYHSFPTLSAGVIFPIYSLPLPK